jgi:hypothetical protein
MRPPRPSPIVCDVGSLPADAAALDALARLQLGARRLGIELRLYGASSELLELVDLAALRDVLCFETRRQAEEREDRLGVEEEGELDDPAG